MKTAIGGLALALALGFAVGAAAQDTPRSGGTITVALTADIRSTDPGINRDSNTDTVLQHAVETPDPQTIRFRLAAPNALFLAQLANFQCFATGTVSPDSLNLDGSWNTPIGSGPYKLASWKHGEAVTLEKFAGYKALSEPASGYAGARIAYADTIRFQIVPDPSTAEAALAAGQVDLLPSLAPAQIDPVKANGGTVETAPGLGWSAILVQTSDPLLSDPRMRLALAHA